MSTKEVFEAMRAAANRAQEAENHLVLENEALARGFTKEDASTTITMKRRYQYDGDDGQRIEIEWRCYDQSGPFQLRPDVNKIELQLLDDTGVLASHRVQYED